MFLLSDIRAGKIRLKIPIFLFLNLLYPHSYRSSSFILSLKFFMNLSRYTRNLSQICSNVQFIPSPIVREFLLRLLKIYSLHFSNKFSVHNTQGCPPHKQLVQQPLFYSLISGSRNPAIFHFEYGINNIHSRFSVLRNVISVYTSHFFNSRSNSKTSVLHNSIASLQVSTSSPSISMLSSPGYLVEK